MTGSTTGRGLEDQAARSSISKLFDDTRKRLVETGTRNRLVHVNRANTRGNFINIVNERSDDVYSILSAGKLMRFLGLGSGMEDQGKIAFVDANSKELDSERYLGWRFHRIWSTDWFYNRKTEIERLRLALSAARAAADQGVRIDGANRASPKPIEAPVVEAEIFQIPEVVARRMPVYQRAIFPVTSWQEPHEVAISTLADLVKRIVGAEGPIHIEEVARRIAACFGKEKAGSRILTATRAALIRAKTADTNLTSDGAFWFTRSQADNPPVRDRSAESGVTLKAESISALEIDEALRIARDDNAGGEDADLVRTAARLMGFRRVGSDLQSRISSRLGALGGKPAKAATPSTQSA